MVHTFPKGICSKGNVIALLESELIYSSSAVQHFNHYTTRTKSSIHEVLSKISNDERLMSCYIYFNSRLSIQ